jgi:DNA-directed RNA polymerases I and III subunit RPAC1
MTELFYRVHSEQQVPELNGTADPLIGQFLEQLKDNLQIDIIFKNEEEIVFDLIGVDASIANALRRILLAEVPTIAIEKVWFSANSGIIQDEVLAHRVGLVPLKLDPRKLDYVQKSAEGEDEETDADTLVLHLNVFFGTSDADTANNAGAINVAPSGDVLSKHLVWLPIGGQKETFPEGVEPVHPDIVLAKLRPGQQIEFEAHAWKGIGKDHAKFSPVATASYRLLPHVSMAEPVVGDEARELKAMCPMNVFDIEDIVPTKGKGSKGGASAGGNNVQAVAARSRDCTMCRECIRKEGWRDKVQLRRKADHFIFTVESTGAMSPDDIVREAIAVLREKATKFSRIVQEREEA